MNKGILVAATIASGLFCQLQAADSTPAPAKPAGGTPKIKFDQTVYDFGKTSQVERVSGVFTFQNVGDGVLKLDKPQPGCGCTVAGVKPEVLQPGEKGELSFTLNMPKYRQSLQKQITVTCNDPQNPKTILHLKAEYVPLYDVLPFSFNLNIRKGESTNIVAKVARVDGQKFTLAKLTPSQTWIEAKAEPDPNSTNNAMAISITVKPEGSPRYFYETLNGYVGDSGAPAFSVILSGRLIGDITLAPESVYWAVADPEKTIATPALATRRIVVRSLVTDKNLEVKNVTSSLGDVNVEVVPREAGKVMELVAKLSAVPTHNTNGVIHFDTNIPSQPRVDIPIIISLIPKAVQPPTAAVSQH